MSYPLSALNRALRTGYATTALVVAAALPQAASAGIVFQSVANLSDAAQVNSAYCSDCGGGFRVFDRFTLNDAASINGFSVSLYSEPGYWPSNVNFSIWTANASNLAGTQIFSQTIASGDFDAVDLNTANWDSVIATTNDVSGLTLNAGTYYVSFYNPTGNGLLVSRYSGGVGNFYQSTSTGEIRREANFSAGFTLTTADRNDVPEPGTLALAGLALFGLSAARRRQS